MKKKLMTVIIMALIVAGLCATNRLIFYHNNFGMVTETVNIPLERGVNNFLYEDIAATLDVNTVMLAPLRKGGFAVQTQSFLNRIDNWYSYINQQLGKEIELVMKDGNLLSGKLIYNDHSMIGLKNEQANTTLLIRGDEIRNFVFKPADDSFVTKPYLQWKLRTDRKDSYQAALTYLCAGLNWEGLYKAVWNDDELRLEVMANISNNTGKDFKDFNVLLIAGEPKKTSPAIMYKRAESFGRGMLESDMMMAAEAVPEFTAEVFDEYHLFTYPETISLSSQQNKQIRLHSPAVLKPDVYYEYVTGSKVVATKLKIMNDKKSGLGEVLPKGKIQLYREKADTQELTFVGEDMVKQTPVNEEWIISPGQAFDIVGETIVKEVRRPSRNVTERDMEVKLNNRGNRRRAIEVTHRLSGTWTISRNNIQYERKDANTIIFKRELRANEEAVINWTERTEY